MYEKIDYYCPNCGKKNVFVEPDGWGDVECGEAFYCIKCNFVFHLPCSDVVEVGDCRMDILDRLRAGNFSYEYPAPIDPDSAIGKLMLQNIKDILDSMARLDKLVNASGDDSGKAIEFARYKPLKDEV